MTLTELLVVMAVVGLLAVLAIPALSSVAKARGSTEAGFQIASAMERARSEAVTRRSFAWLGIQPVTNQGELSLRVAVMVSRDGTTNSTATNLQPALPPALISGAALRDASGLIPGLDLTSATELSQAPEGIAFAIGSVSFQGRPTVTFTPDGEATVLPAPSEMNGFTPRIVLGLVGVRGTAMVENNPTVVVLDGGTGIPSVRRP